MWFKNLTLFRLAEPFEAGAEALAARLEEGVFQPCGRQQPVSHGWVAPLGRQTSDLVHAVNGCLLVCLQVQEKILPAAVINEALGERVKSIEAAQGRTVRRRERETLRDEVLLELLPRAFVRTRRTYAYLEPRSGWLVIDSGGRKAVEELTARLRASLGSLPIRPPRPAAAPAVIMTDWLANGGPPAGFALQDECELRDGAEEGGVVRCKGQDLTGDEIRAHLEAGKQVTRLALSWNERLAFNLAEDLSVRRLRFLDLVREQLDDVNAETAEEVHDAEFALMSGELGLLLPRLLEVFGGEAG